MKKQYLAGIAIGLSFILLSGCKGKPKIPAVTPTQATAASTASPTMPETTSPESESVPAVETMEHKYKDKDLLVSYPSLTGIADTNLMEKLNRIIQQTALSIIEDKGLDKEKDSLDIKYNIRSLTKQKAIILYSGTYTLEGQKAVPVEYYLTLDLAAGQTLRLSHYIDSTALSERIRSGENYSILTNSQVPSDKVKNYFMELTEEEIMKALDGADFSELSPEIFPSVFSYDENGTITVVYPVPEELGYYAVISYIPANK